MEDGINCIGEKVATPQFIPFCKNKKLQNGIKEPKMSAYSTFLIASTIGIFFTLLKLIRRTPQ